MILVDTSVWTDHLRKGDRSLAELLTACSVLMHPFVIGELACGKLRKRHQIFALLTDLPRIAIATDDEVLFFIDVFARRIVGWRVASSMKTDLVLAALKQAPWVRNEPRGLSHHNDRDCVGHRSGNRRMGSEVMHPVAPARRPVAA